MSSRRKLFPIARAPDDLVEAQLIDGERKEFDRAPDKRLVLASQLDIYAVIVVSAVLIVALDSPEVTRIGFLGILGCFVWLAVRLTQRVYTRYVITNLRILRLSGVLRRDYEWIAWNRVTDVAVQRSIIDRLARTATVKIQSANEQSGFKAMTDIPKPYEFAERITELVNDRRSNPAGG